MRRPCGDSEPQTDPPGRTKASFIRCSTPQVVAKKRRRGVVEKRRRDRINSSLLELGRLVPPAPHQQRSAKLEKAEILQMTVDHLKVLQATAGKGHLDALDFLSVGFRECVMEVSRYLSAVEGVASGDPLRCRLISHLGYCSSQRDAAALTLASRFPFHPPQQPTPLPHAFHPHPWAAAVAAVTFGPLPSFRPSEGEAPQRLGQLVQASSFSTQADSTSSPAPLSASLLSAPLPINLYGGYPIAPPCSFTSTRAPPHTPLTGRSLLTPFDLQ